MSRRDKHRYMRLENDGNVLVCTPEIAQQILEEEGPEYTVTEVWMTDDEFNALPDFMGW